MSILQQDEWNPPTVGPGCRFELVDRRHRRLLYSLCVGATGRMSRSSSQQQEIVMTCLTPNKSKKKPKTKKKRKKKKSHGNSCHGVRACFGQATKEEGMPSMLRSSPCTCGMRLQRWTPSDALIACAAMARNCADTLPVRRLRVSDRRLTAIALRRQIAWSCLLASGALPRSES